MMEAIEAIGSLSSVQLLDQSANFWETAWLRHQIEGLER